MRWWINRAAEAGRYPIRQDFRVRTTFIRRLPERRCGATARPRPFHVPPVRNPSRPSTQIAGSSRAYPGGTARGLPRSARLRRRRSGRAGETRTRPNATGGRAPRPRPAAGAGSSEPSDSATTGMADGASRARARRGRLRAARCRARLISVARTADYCPPRSVRDGAEAVRMPPG